jgi:chromosome partitioning protein
VFILAKSQRHFYTVYWVGIDLIQELVMNPKMTSKDAAEVLGISSRQVFKRLISADLPFVRNGTTVHFGYPTARQLFRLAGPSKAVSFQIVKGGTGKTSLACAVAVRANLYGLRVLCIDLDQQGNLTNSFGVDAEATPVMVDILAEGYSFDEAITRVYPGMDILASRIENALLDEVIKLKRLKLDKVYREPLQALKQKYDLIVIDCPPNLGQSVAAVTLGVDQVIAPVIPDSYALSGLQSTRNAIKELEEAYKTKIDLLVTVNKYDPRALLPLAAKQLLSGFPLIHASSEFPDAIARGESIFDNTKPTLAKRDVDQLTRSILRIDNHALKHSDLTTASVLEESFV